VNEGIDVWRAEPGVAIFGLAGEHDDYSAPKLARELATALEEGLHLVVDLRQTTFLGSTSVATLLAARRTADERDLGLVVVIDEVTAWPVRRLFELAHLAEVLPIVPGVDAAIALTRVGRDGTERRAGGERRTGRERRLEASLLQAAERRSGIERRSGDDRRADYP
jgi:anti-anti-sigma factor